MAERAGTITVASVQYGPVRAHAVSLDQAVELIVERAASGVGGYVLTPNVDHIALARHLPALEESYRHAFLSLPDGVPLVALSRALGLPVNEKVSGSDLFEPLIERCAAEGLPVYFLGSTAESCEAAGRVLQARYPQLRIAGANTAVIDPELDPEGTALALRRARASGAKVIFVNLPPRKQVLMHQFAHEYYPAVSIGTGSALTFYSGVVKRAPRWMSRFGLEWLFRLVQEPRRLWRRYLVEDLAALPVFAGMVVKRLGGQALARDEQVGSGRHDLSERADAELFASGDWPTRSRPDCPRPSTTSPVARPSGRVLPDEWWIAPKGSRPDRTA